MKASREISGGFSPGEIVKHADNRSGGDEIGVLIKRCHTHSDYWSVLISDNVVTWFEPNIERFQLKDGSRTRSTGN